MLACLNKEDLLEQGRPAEVGREGKNGQPCCTEGGGHAHLL